MSGNSRLFLTAQWRNLVMLNYEVDRGLLARYVPAMTELDSFEGRTYVSLVGFCFNKTRLLGRLAVPFHADFEEVNLRFYVRRKAGGEDRRGVCFIAEIVPRRAIAWVARLVFGENYLRFPMEHRIEGDADNGMVAYNWRVGDRKCRLFLEAAGEPLVVGQGSLEQFITEHYWGYSRQRSGGCVEYRVAHQPWRVAVATNAGFEGDPTATYGPAFATVLRGKPESAFLADGSSVEVFAGEKIA